MQKMILAVTCLATCAAVLFASTEQQPLNVKTGNWEVDYSIKYSGLPPQMQAMMDRMTPQQRAAMGLDTGRTFKFCVTEKNLNTPWVKGDNNCRWTVLKSTSSDLEVHGTSCRAGQNGEDTELDLKIHALDTEHVRATMHGTDVGNGLNVTLDGNYMGKWMQATCPAEK